MTIEQLHATFLSCGQRYTTDSRKIEGGGIFWAIRGENFDGNDYALKALEDGAAYAVVDSDSKAASSGGQGIIAVENTLTAFRELATYHREHTLHDGKRIPMLALTGTNGKTTTKELVKAVLATKYRLCATEGNLNNNIGVPMTLLRLTPETELAVVEMGASHPGDIRELVDIAHPDCGLITNVGRAHLLGFGSFEGVKNTKAELYDYIFSVGGTCFVNAESDDLKELAAMRQGMKTVMYGKSLQHAAILPSDAMHPFLRLTVNENGMEIGINTSLVGSYNADNVLCALAVGKFFGIAPEAAARAIEGYQPSNNRSQMVHSASNHIIVDAYNANPSSMAAALDNFAAVNADRKAVMLGDMLELGAESVPEHARVLDRVENLHPELAIFVGGEFAAAASEKQKACFLFFDTSALAADYVATVALSGYTILLKGSRGTRMENILAEL